MVTIATSTKQNAVTKKPSSDDVISVWTNDNQNQHTTHMLVSYKTLVEPRTF
jgi:hypothetical protein